MLLGLMDGFGDYNKMRQYQRTSEDELTERLVGENSQEEFEKNLESERKKWEEDISWEMYRSEYGHSEVEKLEEGYYLGLLIEKELFGDDDEYDKAYLQNEEEPFPEELEYDLNEYGYPSRIKVYNNEDDEILIPSPNEEESSQLKKMLRIRHNFPKNKKI
jgi:hypothetical protein